MFSTHAFSESIATATEEALDGVPDPTIRVDGDNMYLGKLTNLVLAYGVGDTLDDLRLESPSLRDIVNLYLSAVDPNASAVNPLTVRKMFENPIALTEGEGLNAYATQTSGGAVQANAIVTLADGALTPVSGEIHTVEFSTTVAGTANEWENNAIDLQETLPQGIYDVVGARLINTNGIAFRFVPIGAQSARPGGIVVDSKSDDIVPFQRNGAMGKWFSFDNDTPPTIDVLEDGTGGTYTGYLDIIKSG